MIESFYRGDGYNVEFVPMQHLDLFNDLRYHLPSTYCPYAPAVVCKSGFCYHHCSTQTLEEARDICKEYAYEEDSVFVVIYYMDKIVEGYYVKQTLNIDEKEEEEEEV